MNIYVGNLPYSANEEDLKEVFAAHGEVTSVRIITDRDTGQSKGFGFIDMPNDEEATAAIEALEGAEFQGRNLRVNQSKPREDRPRGGGGGYRGGGGGGYRGGGGGGHRGGGGGGYRGGGGGGGYRGGGGGGGYRGGGGGGGDRY